ncbi:unnamed protein product, partial [Oikopleura dioica]
SEGKREDGPKSIDSLAEKTGQSLPRFLEVSRGSFLKILCLTHQTICFSNSFHEIKRFMAIMNSSTIKQCHQSISLIKCVRKT